MSTAHPISRPTPAGAVVAGWILPFGTGPASTETPGADLVGSKAARLAFLHRHGYRIPPGFCVTTVAFEQFLAACPAAAALAREVAADLEPGSADRRPDLARRLVACLDDLAIPRPVERAILDAWRSFDPDARYAVRSSATAEDLDQESFAGLHASTLNVHGSADLLAAIRRTWVSLFSEPAVQYRVHRGLPFRAASMAVLVQRMVPAETAGVLFTLDPVSGNPERLVIEGVPGLGDSLVSGRATPETVVLDKRSGRLVHRPVPGGSRCLSRSLTRRLWRLGLRIELTLGVPQDLEWAAREGEVYLLQARPITAHAGQRNWEERQLWTNVNTAEVAPDVLSPITWSVFERCLGDLTASVFRLVGADVSRAPVIGRVAGRCYFNLNTVVAALRPFSGVVRQIPRLGLALGGDPAVLDARRLLDLPADDLPDLGFRWSKYLRSLPRLLANILRHSPLQGDRWCARLQRETTELDLLPIDGLSNPELARSFACVIRTYWKGWDLLYLLTQAGFLPVFDRLCRTWLRDPDLRLGYRLFQALDGLPESQIAMDLGNLASLARQDSELAALVGSDGSWSELRARLPASPGAPRFLAAWEDFMRRHGHHCRGELELLNVRWSETPDYVLRLVRNSMEAGERLHPVERRRRLAADRERATEECQRRLRNPLRRWLFARILRRVQILAVTREVWKDQAVRRLALLRRILVRLGEGLHHAGVLSEPDDIFFLTVDEVVPAATGTPGNDLRVRVAERRREYDANRLISPPPVVRGHREIRLPTRTREHDPSVGDATTVLEGIPVFPGIVEGPARVILRTDDQTQVQPGEVLVAPFTDPAWTPYFVSAAAVAIDQGGILSHGSIVAREFGLPTVTNLREASRVITTGDWIEVDGGSGRVTILRRVGIRAAPP